MELEYKPWENDSARTYACCFKACGFIYRERGVVMVSIQYEDAGYAISSEHM